MTSWLARLSLPARLFLASCLVIVSGAGTLLVVALVFAPVVFYDHLQQAHLPTITAEVRRHVDEAFVTALTVALGVGIIVSVIVAITVTWLISRRLAAPVQDIAAATRRLADGRYGAEVADPRLGPEFATLAAAVTRLSHRLAEADATRQRVTADLAHQLRTPIASLEATLEAVGDGVLEPDAQTVTMLAEQTRRLRTLVADVEKVSRAEERHIVLDPMPSPVGPLVESWVEAARDRYRAAGVALSVRVTPEVPLARVDRDRLAEAVGNLLDNALRHTAQDGTVDVLVDRAREAPASAPGVSVRIRDTGDGFDPQDAERLFGRFYRGARHAVGSGLGLTIARALVDAHGGSLTATSDGPGSGATFTITLPAVTA